MRVCVAHDPVSHWISSCYRYIYRLHNLLSCPVANSATAVWFWTSALLQTWLMFSPKSRLLQQELNTMFGCCHSHDQCFSKSWYNTRKKIGKKKLPRSWQTESLSLVSHWLSIYLISYKIKHQSWLWQHYKQVCILLSVFRWVQICLNWCKTLASNTKI